MQRSSRVALLAVAAMALLQPFASAAEPIARDGKYYLFVSTATKGTHAFRFDATTGKAEPIGAVADTTGALAVHPTQDVIYTSTAAYKIDRQSGKLTQLEKLPSAACWVEVDPTGKLLVTTSCDGATFATYAIKDDGSIGAAASAITWKGKNPHPANTAPHAHAGIFAYDARYLYVPDITSDRILSYKVGAATPKLTPNTAPAVALKPGSAPLDLALHPSARFAYALNEFLSTVTVFRHDGSTGKLTEAQSITTKSQAFTGTNTAAAMQVHPSGMFLYVTNRGDDSLAMFRIDETNGKLTPLGQLKETGKAPAQFRVSPEGKWLVASSANALTIYAVDVNTGFVTTTGATLPADAATSIRFVPVTDVYANPLGGGGAGGGGPRPGAPKPPTQ